MFSEVKQSQSNLALVRSLLEDKQVKCPISLRSLQEVLTSGEPVYVNKKGVEGQLAIVGADDLRKYVETNFSRLGDDPLNTIPHARYLVISPNNPNFTGILYQKLTVDLTANESHAAEIVFSRFDKVATAVSVLFLILMTVGIIIDFYLLEADCATLFDLHTRDEAQGDACRYNVAVKYGIGVMALLGLSAFFSSRANRMSLAREYCRPNQATVSSIVDKAMSKIKSSAEYVLHYDSATNRLTIQ